ncbi:hypothetical protein [Streptomyces xanthochromogenes]|uniref:Integral membrane protein n=1 Tax=Streptomyces xanthochromogenes TaxID=67384 RepID=A0ABQ3A150_9ACTN|nr:hypothetical protein [Streptomyces xanthochromogenes]GGY29240.1 hypothetical protein GCM10010326_23810 [Streptomyces xanthochromogenes]
MNDVKTPRNAARGTWALPLVALAPLAAIGILTERTSTAWNVVSWVLWALSVVLVAVEWAAVLRHRTRQPAQWGMCVLVHAVLAWQLIALLRQ